jgi:hypothetical protein
MDGDECGAISGTNEWQGQQEYWEETCSSIALSNTGPTWLGPGSNPGHRGGKPVTNRQSYGMASDWP